jgi:hypothetical protein
MNLRASPLILVILTLIGTGCGRTEEFVNVSLKTGLETQIEKRDTPVNLMASLSSLPTMNTLLTGPICHQTELRYGYKVDATGVEVIKRVNADSNDLHSNTGFSDVIQKVSLEPMLLSIPRGQPVSIGFFGAITTGFDSGNDCPKIDSYGVAHDSFSLRGILDHQVFSQQSEIPLNIWGINVGSLNVPQASNSNQWLKLNTGASSLNLIITAFPDSPNSYEQAITLSTPITYYIPKPPRFTVKMIQIGGGGATAITPCTDTGGTLTQFDSSLISNDATNPYNINCGSYTVSFLKL